MGILTDSLRRLRRSPLPSLLLILALSAPVAIAAGVPLYADGAVARLLDDRVGPDDEADDPEAAAAAAADRLTFLFSYNRLAGGSRSWGEVVDLDAYFTGAEPPAALELERTDRFIETNGVALARPVEAEEISSVTFASVSDFEAVARFSNGRAARPAGPLDGQDGEPPIEVVIEEGFAQLDELRVGDRLIVVDRNAALDDPARTLNVEVVGVWTDSDQPTKFGEAAAFRKRLVVPSATIIESLSPRFVDIIQNARWRLALDPSEITGDRVESILAASDEMNATAATLLPGTRRLTAPSGLREFRSDEQALRRGLASFSLPLLVLAVSVGFLIVSMTTRRRGAEFAMARRRGTPSRLLVLSAVPEALIVSVGAAVVGIGVGVGVASIIGRTRTFFRFSTDTTLDLGISWSALAPAAAVGVVLVVIQLVPTAALVRRERPTTTVRSESTSTAPWWQRTYLDVFAVVLIAALTVRGVRDSDGQAALLDDPAVILLPSAAAFAAGLVILRSVPVIMRGVAGVLARRDGTAALLAARRAARVPADIAAPLLLLIITASLATFTASLAVTLDLQLLDSAHHRIGAEVSATDVGRETPVASPFVAQDPFSNDGLPDEFAPTTTHAPLNSYAGVWGIDRATATIQVNGSGLTRSTEIPGLSFRGVDPDSFVATSFWRDDYADVSLAELMAPLSVSPNSIVIDERLARSADVGIGDTIRLQLLTNGERAVFDATVAGTFSQFPRWYPDRQSPLVVGRADTVETLAGATHDRTVLFAPDDRFDDRVRVANDLAGRGADLGAFRFTELLVAAEQGEPGRQGVLGLLTIGVVLATVLTLAGFVVSTVVSFRRRTTELGVLRAMGMTKREVTTLALFDLATVMVLGLLFAVGLGLALSRWFIPVLVDTPAGDAPELLPAIAWSAAAAIVAVLAALLAVSGVVIAGTLRRVRLFEAIRLGEA